VKIVVTQRGDDACKRLWQRLLRRYSAVIRLVLAAGALIMMGTGEAARGQIIPRTIAQEIEPRLPRDGIGGAAVAVRIGGRTLFFNYGSADIAQKRPITSDSLFNVASIRKVFEATVVAQAFERSDLAFDDPVSRYVTELQQGGDIRRVTVGQLATHTSGLLLPADHPPWVTQPYTLAEFIRTLNDWKLSEGQEPGWQRIYTHAGYVLLQLVLERRFGSPIAALLDDQVIAPLGLTSTVVPPRGPDGGAGLAPALMSRAVQGYAENGQPVGKPGDQQTYYDFPGTGQMFSTASDLATLLAANLGESPTNPALRQAMQFTQRSVFQVDARNAQAMAWEVEDHDGIVVVDKPGGLNNSSTYIGLVPAQKMGLVILMNRGNQYPHEFGRRFLVALARAHAD
jgi:beta-lactamase class C